MIVNHRTSSLRHVPAPDDDRHDNLKDVTPADESLFAMYQPVYRAVYDLTNPFDRTNISIWIRKFIAKCEDEMVRVERLFRVGLISRPDYLERTDELAWDLQQHHAALSRLGEIGRY